MADEIGKYSSPAALIILAITLATIAGAWAFQLIGGYIPCPLCLQQRVVLLHSRVGRARLSPGSPEGFKHDQPTLWHEDAAALGKGG